MYACLGETYYLFHKVAQKVVSIKLSHFVEERLYTEGYRVSAHMHENNFLEIGHNKIFTHTSGKKFHRFA